MGIPIDLPGLNQFIKEIPEGSIVSVEGGVDPPKSVLVSIFARSASENGWKIVYVCPRGRCGTLQLQRCEWHEGASIVEEASPVHWREKVKGGSLLIIDSLSYLMLGKDLPELRLILEDLRITCKLNGAIIIQLVETDMLDKQMELISGYHADGIIQFLMKDTPDGLSRFIRIPKWMTGASYDRNIYYTYNDGRINIDLRYRVV